MKVATLGEVMLRFKTPGHERFLQSANFEASFGGAECNAAVSLANYGMQSKFITALPENPLSQALCYQVRGFGVDVSDILYTGDRIGTYYQEAGTGPRPSKVIYDRAHSSFAEADPALFDFEKLFKGYDTFFITGITPALCPSKAELTLNAVKAAKAQGMTVALDYNFRSKLWNYGKSAAEIMPEITRYTDWLITNEEACFKCLGLENNYMLNDEEARIENCKALTGQILEAYPNIQKIAFTLRETKSAEHNNWSACLADGKDFYVSGKYSVKNMVDRVGGGDSFASGLLYGLGTYEDAQQALEFAVAASALKLTILGDFNRVTVAEVQALMQGDGSGRIQR